MNNSCRIPSALAALSLAATFLLLVSCSSDGTTTLAPPTGGTVTNPYAAAYQAAKYNNGTTGTMTVSFPSSC
ncbi:MAG: hypothetical protein ABI142_11805, partial [Bryocella sp.]